MLELQFINTLVDNAKVINLGVFKDEKEMTKEINKRCKELNTDVTLVFTDGFCDNINLINKDLLPKRIIYVLTNGGISSYIDKTGFIVRVPE